MAENNGQEKSRTLRDEVTMIVLSLGVGIGMVACSIVLYQRFGVQTASEGIPEYLFSIQLLIMMFVGIGGVLLGSLVFAGTVVNAVYQKVMKHA